MTPYEPKPGTEKTSPIDSTPFGQWTDGVGSKQKAIHEAKEKEAAETATVEVSDQAAGILCLPLIISEVSQSDSKAV